MAVLDPSTAPASIGQHLERIRQPVETFVADTLSSESLVGARAQRLFEAMRHAALGAGKRLRPALTIAASEACGGTLAGALPAACAVELVHAYSLVHDDLPAMDNDDWRRGKPTVHVAFDEATAILAGDGLLTAAFGVLADLGPATADAVSVLARRVGAQELLAGQALDVVGAEFPALHELEVIHAAKTGALFSAAAELGAISAHADRDARADLARYGLCLGIAFQFADDRDDGEHPHLQQAADARRLELCAEAVERLRSFGPRAGVLRALAEWIGAASS